MKFQTAKLSSQLGISVAMATYNGEKYIREQLESLARQTLLPLELVVTDDGSTDATLQIVENFAGVAPFPVRIFRNGSRLGYADNFLKAASLCHGELIAFCDQDDIWTERRLLVCSQYFADSNIVLTVHSAQIQVESGIHNDFCPFYPRFGSTKLLDAPDPIKGEPGFTMVFRNSLLHLVSADDRPRSLNAHDRWVWFLAASAGCIVTIADALTLYRQHGNNTSGGALRQTRPFMMANLQKRISGVWNYDEPADLEIECSHILYQSAEKSSPYADRLRKSAKRLEIRSKFHRLRTGIYKEDSTLWERTCAFLTILFQSGYLPDSSKSRLGPQSAAKDLLFVVFGASRFIVPVDR